MSFEEAAARKAHEEAQKNNLNKLMDSTRNMARAWKEAKSSKFKRLGAWMEAKQSNLASQFSAVVGKPAAKWATKKKADFKTWRDNSYKKLKYLGKDQAAEEQKEKDAKQQASDEYSKYRMARMQAEAEIKQHTASVDAERLSTAERLKG